jgi:hypothetical protein
VDGPGPMQSVMSDTAYLVQPTSGYLVPLHSERLQWVDSVLVEVGVLGAGLVIPNLPNNLCEAGHRHASDLD